MDQTYVLTEKILTLKQLETHTHQQSGKESIFPIGQKMNGIARVQFETATHPFPTNEKLFVASSSS